MGVGEHHVPELEGCTINERRIRRVTAGIQRNVAPFLFNSNALVPSLDARRFSGAGVDCCRNGSNAGRTLFAAISVSSQLSNKELELEMGCIGSAVAS